MTNSQRLALVRQRLLSWLAQHTDESRHADAQDGNDSPVVRESVLIRDGFYCGRRFDAGDFSAVWFMEEDELKIHESDGRLICVFNSQQINQAEVPAAEQALEQESSNTTHPNVITMPERAQPQAADADEDDDHRRAA